MQTNQLALLKTRRFLPLFLTQFLGAFNDNTFKNALVILITYRLAENAQFSPQILVTLASGFFILPYFLFSALAGELADKFEKSRLIVIIKCIEIILMGIAVLGFYWQSVALLMTVLFMLGTHATFFGPLKYSILPDHLKDNELIAGNGLIEAGTFIAILFGTIIGGILILLHSGDFLISLLLLAVAAGGLVSSFFIPQTFSQNSTLKVHFNIFTETYSLMKYTRSQRDIFLSVMGISWFWLVGATFLAEFPVFAKDILHANEHVVTYFLTLFSIGLAIGSLWCNRLLKGEVHATYVPIAAIGITLFTIDLFYAANNAAYSQHLMTLFEFLSHLNGWRISTDLILIAVCGGVYTVPLYALLQQRSDKHHRARVIASNNIMNALFVVVAAILTVIMLNAGMTVNQVFLAAAIANAFVALYICKLLPEILIKTAFRWLLKIVYRVQVKGLENYHNAGKHVVMVANHTAFIDALLLAVFLPDNLIFAINNHTAQKGWGKLFTSLVATYPLDPTNPMALKSLIECVEQDKRCIIFSEGDLALTRALALEEITDKFGGKLLPIQIQGTPTTLFSRLKGKVHILWFPKITITIFPPQSLDVALNMKMGNTDKIP